MPLTLPSIVIQNDAIASRVVAAFPGETQAQKVQAYRNWLTDALTSRVLSFEMQKVSEANRQAELDQERVRRDELQGGIG